MAYAAEEIKTNFISEGDLSSSSYLFAILGTAAQTVAVSGANGVGIGILGDCSSCDAAGKPAPVSVAGIAKLTLGATVAKEALVKADSAGKGTTADTDKDNVRAIALEAGVDGDTISVLVVNFKASI